MLLKLNMRSLLHCHSRQAASGAEENNFNETGILKTANIMGESRDQSCDCLLFQD